MSSTKALSIEGTSGARVALPWLCGAVLLTVVVAAPFLVGNYWLRILTSIFMYAVVTQGLNVIVGFAGYHAFGNSVFFGIGAYAVGVAMALGLPFAASVPLGALVPALAAMLLGWPLLRLKGHYFAIATVALNMAMGSLIINVGGVTGGAMGLPLPLSSLSPDALYTVIYFLMLGAMLIATLTTWWLRNSALGYALRALRDSEQSAEVRGINTTLMKIIAWAISAALTGLAGGIWAYWITFIEPGSAFDIGVSVKGYIMMLIGGMGTVLGPVIGAVFLEAFATIIWGQFLQIHLLMLGLLIIIVVMTIPEGILHYTQKLWRMLERRA
jgi:branched-chain amino acid transport system permease protein